MRKPDPGGIKVPVSSPDFASSRRHFISAATILGGLLLGSTRAVAQRRPPPAGGGGRGVHCFLKGTEILTPEGERPIEELRIGDEVLTLAGEARPIKWIGRRQFERGGQGSWDDAVAPIKIARGAFNGDAPHRDLCVSYGHRFLINGLLVPAVDLVNDDSIVRLKSMRADVLEYLHIELESHDVVLANGVPSETLEGNASRSEFDNFDEYVALYGATLTHQVPYAPIVGCNGRRQVLRSHLRGLLAPIYDRRQPIEIIQDELARQAHRRSAA